MKKKLLLFALTSMMALSICACGSDKNDNDGKDNTTATQENGDENFTPAKDVVEAISKNLNDLPEMTACGMDDEDAQDNFEYLCDIDYSKVSDFYDSYSTDAENAPAQEILVIRMKSEDDVDEAEKELNNRIERRKSQFMTYMPAVLPVMNKAKVVKNGNYVALIVSEDANNALEAFREAAK